MKIRDLLNDLFKRKDNKDCLDVKVEDKVDKSNVVIATLEINEDDEHNIENNDLNNSEDCFQKEESYTKNISFDNNSKIKRDPYLSIDSDEETKQELIEYYKQLFLNKEINNHIIIDANLFEYNNKYLIMFDLQCKSCGRIKRVTALNNDFVCKCKQIRFADWNIAKYLKTDSNINQFISNNIFKNNERLFVIDPQKSISKDNVIKSTFSEFKKSFKKNIEDDKTICQNCGAKYENKKCPICNAQLYSKRDIRYEIVSKRLYEKQDIDNTWEKNIVPYSVNYYYNYEDNSYVDLAVELNLKYYYLDNNTLKRMGLYKVKEINNNYSIVDYLLYINDLGLIKYENVYREFGNKLYEPIIRYIINDKKINPEEDLLESEKMTDLFAIFFLKDEKSNMLTLNVYENDEVVLKAEKVKRVIESIPQKSLLIEFNDGVKKYFDINSYEFFDTDYDGTTEIYNFQDLNTNIILNEKSNYFDESTKKKIFQYHKNDNKRTKLIYLSEDIYVDNLILFDFLKKNYKMELLENEFHNDKTVNYLVKVDRNNKNDVSFIEYILTKSKSNNSKNSFKLLVYGIPLQHITMYLLSKIDIMEKINSLIKNGDIIIQDIDKKDKIMKYIHMNYYTKDLEYDKIITKLLDKYKTDEIGLLILLMYKYGEELVFGLPSYENVKRVAYNYSVGVENQTDTEKNRTLYDQILLQLDGNNIKWKSEFSLYKLLKSYFPDAIYQYRFKELGQQSLDIYIPSSKIAFEYQGLQHYQPVEIFGGKEHFEKQKINDENKRKICADNNIILIEWKYNESINKIILDKKLGEYKDKVKNVYEFNE